MPIMTKDNQFRDVPQRKVKHWQQIGWKLAGLKDFGKDFGKKKWR